MLRQVLMAMGGSDVCRRMIVGFPATAAVVAKFVPGETIDECLDVVRRLADQGLHATIDHLGEDTTTPAQASAAVDTYVTLLRRLAEAGLADRAEVSVKLSALGQALPDGDAVALANARTICAAAAEAGTTVTLDAEDHTTTDRTHATLAALREEFPTTGIVLQAYLHRCPDDCERLAVAGSRVRLCKGAYDEPASVAHRGRREVDESYLSCLRILMKGDGYPMVASHDPRMIAAAGEYADLLDRTDDSYEYQMLYGIRPDEQVRLASEGHRVRVYVPFGTDWYGYYMRRLAERPANLVFFARALLPQRRP